jgi:tetratricopeptide (TPR) repeat protein
VLLAELEGARGNHRLAVSALRSVLELGPELVEERLGQALEGWRAAAAAQGAVAELRGATLELVARARRSGDGAGARRLVGELLAHAEPDVEILRLHAELAESEGDVAAAVDATYNLMQLEQGEAQVAAANRLVDLADRAGRTADAMAAVEQMVAAHPDQSELAGLLLRLYEQAGERRKLAALLYEVARRTTDEGERFEQTRRAGALALESGDPSLATLAATALHDALALRPGDEATALLASDAYVRAGALKDASDVLKPFVAAHKGMPSAALAALYSRLAHIAGLAGDAKAELAALTRAFDADKKNGDILGALAERAEVAGDLDLALKALRLIIANAGNGAGNGAANPGGPISVPDAFLRQARIVHRRGEPERAIMFARRAAQEAQKGDPIDRAARELIAALGGEPARTKRSS